MMRTRTVRRVGAGLAAAVLLLGVGALLGGAGDDSGPGPGAPTATSPTDTDPGGDTDAESGEAGTLGLDVQWRPGPWPEAMMAGQPILLPASPVHGPLVTDPDGWAHDYLPTPTAAVIAAWRHGFFLQAAYPAVWDKVITGIMADTTAWPTPANPGPGWQIPPVLLAATDGVNVLQLGATAEVISSSPLTAVVSIYNEVRREDGVIELRRSDQTVLYRDQQWLLTAPPESVLVSTTPSSFLLPGPSADGAGEGR